MDTPYQVEYGCAEWQDTKDCTTLDEAQAFANNSSNMIMGLYPATYCWIEHNGEIVETILNEDEELEE